ncbi:type II toxin-antitoxin system Rv0910 family toxin [Micromonospora eburnea]|uniref:Polyketide cyclase / dehydrase and lipid transport n=1 Tax=Micromonospora eburnea TaxID=227316 RepID=A0A1C6UJ81_9ACTN|nr:SRPBCC family protein [Micromonospora eburnea]SCL53959.1 Polyketide cyclase / dehydrase and lipid transport [Micromonospora eburnea]
MATATGTIELASSAPDVWRAATDFGRFPEWLAIHRKWVGDHPVGPVVGESCQQEVVLLGPPATITWTVATVVPDTALELTGRGPSGIRARFSCSVASVGAITELTLELEFTGGPLTGPIDVMIEKSAKSQLEASLEKFRAMVS